MKCCMQDAVTWVVSTHIGQPVPKYVIPATHFKK